MEKLNDLLREYAQAIRRDDGTAFMHADAIRNLSLQAQCDEHLARIAELEADRDSWRDQASQRLADWDEMRKERDALKVDAERRRELCNDLANIMHDQTVAMQSALIEWKFGKGAEEGLQWIVNTLDGPGLLPDTDAEHGNNAQFWFDTHRSHPFPKCFCGNPSHTLWMGQGFCCNEHYKEAKAKYDSKAEKETRS